MQTQDLEKRDSETTSKRSEVHSETHPKGVSSPAGPPGVRRIEEMKILLDTSKRGKTLKTIFAVSILVCTWAMTLDYGTTISYGPYAASSFNRHSMLSTLSIATSIISAVSRPIIAKISDLTLRPYTYILCLVLYVMGTIITASSRSMSAFIVGEVFSSIGQSGVTLLNSILIADLTSLKWRGLATSMLTSPYIINTWFAGLIVDAMVPEQWRWGYGMFAIIIPVSIAPAIILMLFYDRIAQSEVTPSEKQPSRDWKHLIKKGFVEADVVGLLLMGFGWSLLLLPFSLTASASGGWQNPSMIAMVVVGGILLILYFTYNSLWAPYPSMPIRVLKNKTFLCAVIIDFFYMLSDGVGNLFFPSYTLIVKDWSVQDWTYFNNAMTVCLCVFSILAGAIHRITHRYKYLQVFGICIKIVGYGIKLDGRQGTVNTGALVMSQILSGIGGAFSVVSTTVASQASVHHEDVSQVIAILSLWMGIGGAVGSTICSAIWNNNVPQYLREYMPESVSSETIALFFGNVGLLKEQPFLGEVRQAAIRAYAATGYYMFAPAVGLSFFTLIAALCQTNYYLGDQQNAADEIAEIENQPNDQTSLWRRAFGVVKN